MTQSAIAPFSFPSPLPKDAILAWARGASNVQCGWKYEPQKRKGLQGGPGVHAWLVLLVTRIRQYGIDDYRQTANPNDPTLLQANLSGQRRITVQFRAESLQVDTVPAYELCERIRWAGKSVLMAPLNALGVAFAHAEDIQILPEQRLDNRALSVAVLDMHFNWVVNTRQQAAVPQAPGDAGRTINTVNSGDQAPSSPSTILGTTQNR